MSLADYLAKNYLTADSPKQTEKKSKKRKRKAGTTRSESGLIIAEDDITGWEKKNDSGDEDAPTTGIIIIYTIPFPLPSSPHPVTFFFLSSIQYIYIN